MKNSLFFYRELMESEAGHYTTFITYARKYGIGIDVESRWREWILKPPNNYGKRFNSRLSQNRSIIFILESSLTSMF
jgi:hypothetical protein